MAAATNGEPGGLGAFAAAACPAGWMCIEPAAKSPIPGLVFTDPAGVPVMYTCNDGTMNIGSCDDENPKSTCGALTDPFCARIMVSGMSLKACAQRCAP